MLTNVTALGCHQLLVPKFPKHLDCLKMGCLGGLPYFIGGVHECYTFCDGSNINYRKVLGDQKDMAETMRV